jgi:hypothetical protein
MTRDDKAQSTLRILDEPFVFTQRPALTVEAFGKELRERNIITWPEPGQVEAFHRAGLLVPIYSIRCDPRLVQSRALAEGRKLSREDIRALIDYTRTYGYQLLGERTIGDLTSPAEEGYDSWRRQRRSFAGRPYRTRQYLYSHYQLLAVPMITELWPNLRGRLGGTWRLNLSDRWLEHYRTRAGWFARMVVPLTILEPVYLPEIVENASLPGLSDDFAAFDRFRFDFDPAAALSRIGWSVEEVLKVAEALLAQGHGMDPAAAFHEITRLIHPSHWKKLKGNSRTAMDYRVAGEMFLSFYEDLVRVGAATPLEPLVGRGWHPRLERLRTDRSELDQVLTRFGISPHPAVVAVLEGEVEARIVPLVLNQLYDRRWRSRVRLFDAQGVDTPLGALAAFAAVPVPTESERDVIPLARHPTRFFVLSDAEGSNASDDQREQKRQGWIDRIHAALPPDIRSEVDRSELDHLVGIIVWDPDGHDFERAHFTDEELADGLLAIGPNGPPREEVLRRLIDLRARRLNLKRVWHEWDAPKPSKPALAMQLWPILSKRIDEAREDASTQTVPVLTAVREMVQLAYKFPRHWGVVMQRRKTADDA